MTFCNSNTVLLEVLDWTDLFSLFIYQTTANLAASGPSGLLPLLLAFFPLTVHVQCFLCSTEQLMLYFLGVSFF